MGAEDDIQRIGTLNGRRGHGGAESRTEKTTLSRWHGQLTRLLSRAWLIRRGCSERDRAPLQSV